MKEENDPLSLPLNSSLAMTSVVQDSVAIFSSHALEEKQLSINLDSMPDLHRTIG